MRARLVYNPSAGGGDDPTEDLANRLVDAGLDVEHEPDPDDHALRQALERPYDLVIAAGGDGTFGRVARALHAHEGPNARTPLASLPLGTANNIARTLGMNANWRDAVRELPNGRPNAFDIGRIRGGRGPHTFLEATGAALLARMMHTHVAKENKEPPDVLRSLREILPGYRPQELELQIDGRDHSGAYLLLEIMNIPSIGPRLDLAPDARYDDGAFDVVLVEEHHRDALLELIDARIAGKGSNWQPPNAVRAREVTLGTNGSALHIDDEARLEPADGDTEAEGPRGRLELDVDPGGLVVWQLR